MKLLKKVYKLLMLFWNAQKRVVEQPWKAFGVGTASTEPFQETCVRPGSPLSSESKPMSSPYDELIDFRILAHDVGFRVYMVESRIRLPMDLSEMNLEAPILSDLPLLPPQIFHQIINPEHYE
jgi:hypothetical protein